MVIKIAHFYGTLQGNRGEVTRMGDRASGITATVASDEGNVTVRLVSMGNRSRVIVSTGPWFRGRGISYPEQKIVATVALSKIADLFESTSIDEHHQWVIAQLRSIIDLRNTSVAKGDEDFQIWASGVEFTLWGMVKQMQIELPDDLQESSPDQAF